MCDEILAESKDSFMDSDSFVIKLREKFDLVSQVRTILFEKWDEEKFIYNTLLSKIQLIPKYIDKISMFTALKSLVQKSILKESGVVNVVMLKSFID